MKRILIVTPTLRNGGGVIRGLQNMLSLMSNDKYKISVLPMGYSDSDNVELINCIVLSNDFILTAITAIYRQTINYKHRFLLKIAKIILSILNKVKCRYCFENYLFSKIAKKFNDYDVVIAYQEGLCTRFVQYIETNYRIAWIHCDYSEYRKVYLRNEEYIYSRYKRIVCVSDFTLQKFQQFYPLLKERCLSIYNVLDKLFIRQASMEFMPIELNENNVVKIISIGRLHPVKQFHLIPNIIYQMLNLGVTEFKWILIGGGVDSEEYKLMMSEVKRLNISEKFFSYLGSQFNPYPYIKNCDILVSVSLSEACPFVVNEARVLGVPVVSNTYPSIYELVNNNVDGCICSIGEMANILTTLIKNRDMLNKLKNGMINNDYNNDLLLTKIMHLFDL